MVPFNPVTFRSPFWFSHGYLTQHVRNWAPPLALTSASPLVSRAWLSALAPASDPEEAPTSPLGMLLPLPQAGMAAGHMELAPGASPNPFLSPGCCLASLIVLSSAGKLTILRRI